MDIRAFAAELKRRKVWQVVAIYAAAAAGVIGVADVALPVLQLPPWTVTFVVVLTILGFPLAIALAWSYDITRGGIGRTPARDAVTTTSMPARLNENAPRSAPADVSIETSEPSIVVLPFDNLSPDPGDAYFSDGLTDEIITNLSHLRGLRVISRNSAMALKGTGKDTRTIGRDLDVRYVLEGSVRKAGQALRITTQLIDAGRDQHLWAEKYEGVLADIFGIQEQVSQSIVDALELRLTSDEERRIHERRIDSVPAYECYLRAVAEVWHQTSETIDHAIRHLQDAIEILGPNPHLYAGMAYAHWSRVNIGMAQEDGIALTDEYVCKALELDPESSIALTVKAAWEAAFQGNVPEAIRYLKRALRSNPDETMALGFLATGYINFLGAPAHAEPLVRRLMKIDPLSPFTHWELGALPFFQGKFDEASAAWGRLQDMDPDNPMWQFYHAWALAYTGNYESALRLLEDDASPEGGDAPSRFSRILRCALRGDQEGALHELTPDLLRTVARDGAWAHHVAAPLALVGARDEALGLLRQGLDAGLVNYPMLAHHDPFLAQLRGDPGYETFLEDVKHRWEASEL